MITPLIRRGSSSNQRVSRRLTARLLAVGTVVLALGGMAAGPAQALENELALRDSTNMNLRNTFVFDPGIGEYLTRARLLERDDYYRARGFDRDFLTWAPQRPVTPDGTTEWARCGTPGDGTLCPDGTPLSYGLVRNTVENGDLTTLAHGDAFIALVCGNHSRTGANVPPPTISGTKYEDLDGDGTQDIGEPGLPGWTIRLLYEGQGVTTTTTGASGEYSFALSAERFPQLSGGTYSVEEVLQPGWVQSAAPAAVEVETGDAGVPFTGNDFGNYRPATIAGRKFGDANVDGDGTGDPSLSGWEITLNGRSTTTDADGYAFDGLAPGTYTVSETLKDGWRQTAPSSGSHTVTVRSGEVRSGVDFGNVCLGSTAITVRDISTGAPLASGLELRIEEVDVPGILENDPDLPRTGTSPTTFDELLPGTYRVTAFLPDGVFTTDDDATVVEGRWAIVKQITVGACAETALELSTFTKSRGFVTGGFRFDLADGFATGGFEFMARDGVARGTLEHQDHARPANLHTKEIDGLWVEGNTAWVWGYVTMDGERSRFLLKLVDNGEPGREDVYELDLTNGYSAHWKPVFRGNVQIHTGGPA